MPLSDLGYEPDELAAAMKHLRRQAEAEGIEFAPRSPESLLANTHRALAASAIVQTRGPGALRGLPPRALSREFRRAAGHRGPRGPARDRGGPGIDAARLDAALAAGAGEAALREAAEEARRRGIVAVPAFVFDGQAIVVGAQPPEVLGQAVERAVSRRP